MYLYICLSSCDLDSASSKFVQCVNRRVSSASTDLNVLESMSLGIVSFEELLGHCSEVYKKNQSDLVELEDSLKRFGYVPGKNQLKAQVFVLLFLINH